MRTEFMGEDATLTALFGEDVESDIAAVARETNLPISTVRSLVTEYAPELMGAETAPKGSAFANVFESMARGIGAAAPGIAQAIKGQSSTAIAPAPAAAFDPMKLLIPAGIGIVLLLLIMKK